MTSLGIGRSLWQLSALAPRLAPILLFSDLLEIESALPKIKTAQLEIEIALLEIEILSNKVANNYQPDEGLVEV